MLGGYVELNWLRAQHFVLVEEVNSNKKTEGRQEGGDVPCGYFNLKNTPTCLWLYWLFSMNQREHGGSLPLL